MTDLITTNQIEETKSYRDMQKFQKDLATKRQNRTILEQALIHYRTTGEILKHIGLNNVKILTEIIEKYECKSNSD